MTSRDNTTASDTARHWCMGSCVLALFAMACLAQPPAPVDKDHGAVEGIVVDEEGNPVGGAQVHALRYRWEHPLDPFQDAVDVVTDPDGLFHAKLLPGSYMVVARKGLLTSEGAPRSARNWDIRAGAALRQIRLPLMKGGRVTGAVVAAEGGKVLADAGVILENGLVTRTDDEGRFAFAGVGFGEHTVKAVYPGMADRHVAINTAEHEEMDVRVEMKPGYVVRGTVTDEQGNPVVGAVVSDHYSGSIVHCFMHCCYTDEDGEYELKSYPFGKKLFGMGVYHGDFANKSQGGLSPPENGTVLTVDIVLDKGYAVQGHVQDANGKPIRDATVQYNMSRSNVHYKETTTDAKGFFRLDKLATDRKEYLMAHARGYAPAYQKATPGRGETVPKLQFTLGPESVITGKVVDRDGKPIEGATVSPQISVEGRGHGDYFAWQVPTDKEGRFKLDSMPKTGVSADVYRFGDYSPVRRRPLNVGGENVIVLDPPGVIVGKVVDAASGGPVTAFNVKLSFPTGPSKPDEPSASYSAHLSSRSRGQDCRSEKGLFTIDDLICRAPHAVIVSAEGYAQARVDRVVAGPKDDGRWPVEIKLGRVETFVDRARTVSGTVIDADSGEPVAEAEVILLMPSYPRDFRASIDMLEKLSGRRVTVQRAGTDGRGRFTFEGVPAGQVSDIAVRHGDYALLYVKRVDGGKPVALKLSPGGVIEGSMDSYPGVPLQDARVWLQTRGDVPDMRQKEPDTDGGFRFTNLPPGDYSVSLMHERRNCRTERVTLAAGETLRVDFGNLPGATLSGRLTRAGEPVPGANVELHAGASYNPVARVVTDAQGRYRIPGVSPGEHALTANDRKGEVWNPVGPYSRTRQLVTVGDDDLEVNLSFHSGRVQGRIADAATGRPPRGDLSIYGYRIRPTKAVPDMHVGCRVLESGELRFSTTEVGLYNPRGLGLLATTRIGDPSDRTDYLHSRGGDDGTFELLGAAPGTYAIVVRGPENGAPALVANAIVGAEGTSDPIDIRLDASAVLLLTIRDAATGAPVSKARVYLCAPNGAFLASRVQKAPPTVTTEPDGTLVSVRFQREPLASDEEGRVLIEKLRAGNYGLWVVASGYCPQWVVPLEARDFKEGAPATVTKLQPAGTLILGAAPDLLDGVDHPYVAYRITDSKGRAVFPGGEVQDKGPVETGIAPIGASDEDAYRVDVLPPGDYTLTWEVRPARPTRRHAQPTPPPVCSGSAEFSIRVGEETSVVLSGDADGQ